MSVETASAPDDGELLALIAAGDREAFGAFYSRHAPWLLLRLRRRTASVQVVEELLQDTFLAVWRNASTFRGSDAGGWVWTIASRRVVDAARRSVVRPIEQFGLPIVETASSAEDAVLGSLLRPDLEDAWAALSPELRAVLQATVIDGLSVREAAVVLDVPEGTVKSRASRARALLRAHLLSSPSVQEGS